MITSIKNEYVFISVPKTGTHTMYDVLVKQFDGIQAEGPYHQTQIPEKFSDFFAFSTVRHPFTRMVSIWHALTQRPAYQDIFIPKIGGKSFLQFCKWYSEITPENRPTGKGGVLLLSQSEWLAGVKIDRFLKIECINKDFSELPFVHQVIELPKMLSREYAGWHEVSCTESKRLLTERLARDFEILDYSPEVVPEK